uniref:Midasin n=1 Tax=Chromera velia CCMP2878 TaxID=1169474 RepID=A0A0G4HWH0_9ALVE|eukprot:Cvel_9014.t1-p1 / transcript=Cvel_9014.t1 / gene=Cvel_9014 / organism=Chromera_velia_CCMP2878 / gene_product=Midasin, putative / transcript_product=Midasin, putative / location=Cvel_scaffold510:25458-53436(+) / protein_length=7210 / sequence_SO=supercontig / SO=protein_coding / is_pseudo=false
MASGGRPNEDTGGRSSVLHCATSSTAFNDLKGSLTGGGDECDRRFAESPRLCTAAFLHLLREARHWSPREWEDLAVLSARLALQHEGVRDQFVQVITQQSQGDAAEAGRGGACAPFFFSLCETLKDIPGGEVPVGLRERARRVVHAGALMLRTFLLVSAMTLHGGLSEERRKRTLGDLGGGSVKEWTEWEVVGRPPGTRGVCAGELPLRRLFLESVGDPLLDLGRLRVGASSAASASSSSLLSLESLQDNLGLSRASVLALVPSAASTARSGERVPEGEGGDGMSGDVFVATPTAVEVLHHLMAAVCGGSGGSAVRPILLTGPAGTGKSLLVRRCASLLGVPPPLCLFVDDQTDSRSLIGSFVFGEAAGEFVWRPGVLAKAMAEGQWLVIEQIDKIPPEILATVLPLVDGRSIPNPQNRQAGAAIRAHPSFRLFGTLSSPYAAATGGSLLPGGTGGKNSEEVKGDVVMLEPSSSSAAVAGCASSAREEEERRKALALRLSISSGSAAGIQWFGSVKESEEEREGGDEGGSASSSGPLPVLRVPSLAAQWHRLEVPPPGCEDILAVLKHRFPQLDPVLLDVLRSFEGVGRVLREQKGGGRGQSVILRDAVKVCKRLCGLRLEKVFSSEGEKGSVRRGEGGRVFIPEALRVHIVEETAAILLGHVASMRLRRRCAFELASVWGLSEELSTLELFEGNPPVSVGAGDEGKGRVVEVSGRSFSPLGSHGPPLEEGGEGGIGSSRFALTSVQSRLLRRLVSGLVARENLLLVGDTGTGKTAAVQYLAALLGVNLCVFNFSDQAEASELIGNFKPVESTAQMVPRIFRRFTGELFPRSLSTSKNAGLLASLHARFASRDWEPLLAALVQTSDKVIAKYTEKVGEESRRGPSKKTLMAEWNELRKDALKAASLLKAEKDREKERQRTGETGPGVDALRFDFQEGILVQALRKGDWILLDELNLAPPETLQRLLGLLESSSAPFLVPEKGGGAESVPRHPAFRLFACMNPALLPPVGDAEEKMKASNGRSTAATTTEGDGDPSSGPVALSGDAYGGALTGSASAGKKELPPAVRQTFTELFVDELERREDLELVVRLYLSGIGARPPVGATVSLYLEARRMCRKMEILDGAGKAPHFSLRTLVRALRFASAVCKRQHRPCKFTDGLADGFLVSFATPLDDQSAKKMETQTRASFGLPPAASPEIARASAASAAKRKTGGGVLPSFAAARAKVSIEQVKPSQEIGDVERDESTVLSPTQSVSIEGFWIAAGPEPIDVDAAHERFVVTPSVMAHLKNLARVLSGLRTPILLEGPTSAGKTSLVEFLCRLTGHRFVRVNNHEHTDLQEYLGQYVCDPRTGQLVFEEGVLVQAARRGDWIVLDELNLAPSEILEALNRLLDDNRELFIPETNTVVRPHPDFQVFATQNPAGGSYGGRKLLSRAFRNRFVEVQLGSIPSSELETIVSSRCRIAPSMVASMVKVYDELARMRLSSSIFAGSQSFMTVRDLLRWGSRQPESVQALAEEGFCLVAERLRSDEEKSQVRMALEKHILKGQALRMHYEKDPFVLDVKRRLQEALEAVCSGNAGPEHLPQGLPPGGLSWTPELCRMVALVSRAVRSKEAVLLVGETGGGKTTVCQLVAWLEGEAARVRQSSQSPRMVLAAEDIRQQEQQADLLILNCHQNTETADLLGSLRPVRDHARMAKEAHESASRLSRVLSRPAELGPVAAAEWERDLEGLEKVQSAVLDAVAAVCAQRAKELAVVLELSGQLNVKQQQQQTGNGETSGVSGMGGDTEGKLRAVSALCAHVNATVEGKVSELLSQIKTDGSGGGRAHLEDSQKKRRVPEVAPSEAETAVQRELRVWLSLGRRVRDAGERLVLSLRRSAQIFEWVDGPLVQAMRSGSHLLVDEISLAEDSVLERLNSVLEPGRSLLLAEKGGGDIEALVAVENFRLYATMNPGGDFGKRELSPALRNRFTEIWIPPWEAGSATASLLVEQRLALPVGEGVAEGTESTVGPLIVRTVRWYNSHARNPLSIREVIRWVDFVRVLVERLESQGWGFLSDKAGKGARPRRGQRAQKAERERESEESDQKIERALNAFMHGALMTIADAFGAGNSLNEQGVGEGGCEEDGEEAEGGGGTPASAPGGSGAKSGTSRRNTANSAAAAAAGPRFTLPEEVLREIGKESHEGMIGSSAEETERRRHTQRLLVFCLRQAGRFLTQACSRPVTGTTPQPTPSTAGRKKAAAGAAAPPAVSSEDGARAREARLQCVWSRLVEDFSPVSGGSGWVFRALDDEEGGFRVSPDEQTMSFGPFEVQRAQVVVQESSPSAAASAEEEGADEKMDAGGDETDTPDSSTVVSSFAFDAPTTADNVGRILRALTLHSAILLEGSPGIGKTAVVQALAQACGRSLVRINISEQTDMMDLLGSDLPASAASSETHDVIEEEGLPEGGTSPFRWQDGPLLSAMQSGDWVLLDELNLASQSVLEGLNALLDHRQEVFVPEIDRVVRCAPSFRLFGAQNPTDQGGGRRGLPRSFLNRFTRLRLPPLTRADILCICGQKFGKEDEEEKSGEQERRGGIDEKTLEQIVDFISAAESLLRSPRSALRGNPDWEFNLRDTLRLCSLIQEGVLSGGSAEAAARLVGESRLRNGAEVAAVESLVVKFFRKADKGIVGMGGKGSKLLNASLLGLCGDEEGVQEKGQIGGSEGKTVVGPATSNSEGLPLPPCLLPNFFRVTEEKVRFGTVVLPRKVNPETGCSSEEGERPRLTSLMPESREAAAALAVAVRMQWPALLTGGKQTGKAWMVRWLAHLVGARLVEFPLLPSTDSSDLLGCFEQRDEEREREGLKEACRKLYRHAVSTAMGREEEGEKAVASFAAMSTLGSLLWSVVSNLSAEVENLKVRVTDFLKASEEIIGDEGSDLVNAVRQRLSAVEELVALGKGGTDGQNQRASSFEWVEGALVSAVREGHWVLLRHAQLCPAAVLDRLNSLLEPGGFLLLAESGTPVKVWPHKDFRIFFTLATESAGGQSVSRALRNRCLEIHVGRETAVGFARCVSAKVPRGFSSQTSGGSPAAERADGSREAGEDGDVLPESFSALQSWAGNALLEVVETLSSLCGREETAERTRELSTVFWDHVSVLCGGEGRVSSSLGEKGKRKDADASRALSVEDICSAICRKIRNLMGPAGDWSSSSSAQMGGGVRSLGLMLASMRICVISAAASLGSLHTVSEAGSSSLSQEGEGGGMVGALSMDSFSKGGKRTAPVGLSEGEGGVKRARGHMGEGSGDSYERPVPLSVSSLMALSVGLAVALFEHFLFLTSLPAPLSEGAEDEYRAEAPGEGQKGKGKAEEGLILLAEAEALTGKAGGASAARRATAKTGVARERLTAREVQRRREAEETARNFALASGPSGSFEGGAAWGDGGQSVRAGVCAESARASFLRLLGAEGSVSIETAKDLLVSAVCEGLLQTFSRLLPSLVGGGAGKARKSVLAVLVSSVETAVKAAESVGRLSHPLRVLSLGLSVDVPLEHKGEPKDQRNTCGGGIMKPLLAAGVLQTVREARTMMTVLQESSGRLLSGNCLPLSVFLLLFSLREEAAAGDARRGRRGETARALLDCSVDDASLATKFSPMFDHSLKTFEISSELGGGIHTILAELARALCLFEERKSAQGDLDKSELSSLVNFSDLSAAACRIVLAKSDPSSVAFGNFVLAALLFCWERGRSRSDPAVSAVESKSADGGGSGGGRRVRPLLEVSRLFEEGALTAERLPSPLLAIASPSLLRAVLDSVEKIVSAWAGEGRSFFELSKDPGAAVSSTEFVNAVRGVLSPAVSLCRFLVSTGVSLNSTGGWKDGWDSIAPDFHSQLSSLRKAAVRLLSLKTSVAVGQSAAMDGFEKAVEHLLHDRAVAWIVGAEGDREGSPPDSTRFVPFRRAYRSALEFALETRLHALIPGGNLSKEATNKTNGFRGHAVRLREVADLCALVRSCGALRAGGSRSQAEALEDRLSSAFAERGLDRLGDRDKSGEEKDAEGGAGKDMQEETVEGETSRLLRAFRSLHLQELLFLLPGELLERLRYLPRLRTEGGEEEGEDKRAVYDWLDSLFCQLLPHFSQMMQTSAGGGVRRDGSSTRSVSGGVGAGRGLQWPVVSSWAALRQVMWLSDGKRSASSGDADGEKRAEEEKEGTIRRVRGLATALLSASLSWLWSSDSPLGDGKEGESAEGGESIGSVSLMGPAGPLSLVVLEPDASRNLRKLWQNCHGSGSRSSTGGGSMKARAVTGSKRKKTAQEVAAGVAGGAYVVRSGYGCGLSGVGFRSSLCLSVCSAALEGGAPRVNEMRRGLAEVVRLCSRRPSLWLGDGEGKEEGEGGSVVCQREGGWSDSRETSLLLSEASSVLLGACGRTHGQSLESALSEERGMSDLLLSVLSSPQAERERTRGAPRDDNGDVDMEGSAAEKNSVPEEVVETLVALILVLASHRSLHQGGEVGGGTSRLQMLLEGFAWALVGLVRARQAAAAGRQCAEEALQAESEREGAVWSLASRRQEREVSEFEAFAVDGVLPLSTPSEGMIGMGGGTAALLSLSEDAMAHRVRMLESVAVLRPPLDPQAVQMPLEEIKERGVKKKGVNTGERLVAEASDLLNRLNSFLSRTFNLSYLTKIMPPLESVTTAAQKVIDAHNARDEGLLLSSAKKAVGDLSSPSLVFLSGQVSGGLPGHFAASVGSCCRLVSSRHPLFPDVIEPFELGLRCGALGVGRALTALIPPLEWELWGGPPSPSTEPSVGSRGGTEGGMRGSLSRLLSFPQVSVLEAEEEGGMMEGGESVGVRPAERALWTLQCISARASCHPVLSVSGIRASERLRGSLRQVASLIEADRRKLQEEEMQLKAEWKQDLGESDEEEEDEAGVSSRKGKGEKKQRDPAAERDVAVLFPLFADSEAGKEMTQRGIVEEQEGSTGGGGFYGQWGAARGAQNSPKGCRGKDAGGERDGREKWNVTASELRLLWDLLLSLGGGAGDDLGGMGETEVSKKKRRETDGKVKREEAVAAQRDALMESLSRAMDLLSSQAPDLPSSCSSDDTHKTQKAAFPLPPWLDEQAAPAAQLAAVSAARSLGEDPLLLGAAEDSEVRELLLENDADRGDAGGGETEADERRRIEKEKARKIRFRDLTKKLRRQRNASATAASSFYAASNPALSGSVWPSVEGLLRRVDALLSSNEFEGDPALLGIRKAVKAIATYPVLQCPPVQMLTALELVLDRSQLWESRAHRGISLADELTKVQRAVLSLRRRQLDDWRHLRDHREVFWASRAERWVGHLVSVVSEGVAANEVEDEEESVSRPPTGPVSAEEQAQLWDELLKFIRTAPLGEFEARLRLMATVSLLFLQSPVERERTSAGVMGHAARFASVWEPAIVTALSASRKKLDKEVADIRSLSRWDFSNHDAMKETVHRSHFQLRKALRRFDAFLEELTDHHLSTHTSAIRALKLPPPPPGLFDEVKDEKGKGGDEGDGTGEGTQTAAAPAQPGDKKKNKRAKQKKGKRKGKEAAAGKTAEGDKKEQDESAPLFEYLLEALESAPVSSIQPQAETAIGVEGDGMQDVEETAAVSTADPAFWDRPDLVEQSLPSLIARMCRLTSKRILPRLFGLSSPSASQLASDLSEELLSSVHRGPHLDVNMKRRLVSTMREELLAFGFAPLNVPGGPQVALRDFGSLLSSSVSNLGESAETFLQEGTEDSFASLATEAQERGRTSVETSLYPLLHLSLSLSQQEPHSDVRAEYMRVTGVCASALRSALEQRDRAMKFADVLRELKALTLSALSGPSVSVPLSLLQSAFRTLDDLLQAALQLGSLLPSAEGGTVQSGVERPPLVDDQGAAFVPALGGGEAAAAAERGLLSFVDRVVAAVEEVKGSVKETAEAGRLRDSAVVEEGEQASLRVRVSFMESLFKGMDRAANVGLTGSAAYLRGSGKALSAEVPQVALVGFRECAERLRETSVRLQSNMGGSGEEGGDGNKDVRRTRAALVKSCLLAVQAAIRSTDASLFTLKKEKKSKQKSKEKTADLSGDNKEEEEEEEESVPVPCLTSPPSLELTLPLSEVLSALQTHCGGCVSGEQREGDPALSFVREVVRLADLVLLGAWDCASACGSLGVRLFQTSKVLLEKGYCRPQEGEGQEGEGGDEWVEGTGLGEGGGQKDISDEIEEEGQMEGLRGEEEAPEEEKKDNEEEDKAREVEMEFDGKMENKRQPGEGEENSEEDEDEVDRQRGDVDLNQGGELEEKLWDGDEDESDESDDDQDDKENKEGGKEEDITAKGGKGSGETDLAAKDDGDDGEKDKREKDGEPEGKKKEDGKEQEKEGDGEDEEEEEGDTGEGKEGTQFEVSVPQPKAGEGAGDGDADGEDGEGEKDLDIDEDMRLDEEGEKDGEEKEEEGEGPEGDGEKEEEERFGKGALPPPDETEDVDQDQKGDGEEKVEGEKGENAEKDNDKEDGGEREEGEKNDEDGDQKDESMSPDADKDKDKEGEETGDKEEEKSAENPPAEEGEDQKEEGEGEKEKPKDSAVQGLQDPQEENPDVLPPPPEGEEEKDEADVPEEEQEEDSGKTAQDKKEAEGEEEAEAVPFGDANAPAKPESRDPDEEEQEQPNQSRLQAPAEPTEDAPQSATAQAEDQTDQRAAAQTQQDRNWQRPPSRPTPPNPFSDPPESSEEWLKKVTLFDEQQETGEEEEGGDGDQEEKEKEDITAHQQYERDDKKGKEALAEVSGQEEKDKTEGEEEKGKEKESKVKGMMDEDNKEDRLEEEKGKKQEGQKEEEKEGEKKNPNQSSIQVPDPKKRTSAQDDLEGLGEDEEMAEDAADPLSEADRRRREALEDADELKRRANESLSVPVSASQGIHEGTVPDAQVDEEMDGREEAGDQIVSMEVEDVDTHLMPHAAAADLWRTYESLSSGPSAALAEQLRILLEPTKRGRLQGDFRTGKRISMRKVISFIASNFRKDKIWLRRTKASKREYQVLVCVDSSKSMSEMGVGPLALQAVGTICQALSRLEVGRFGVLSFGGETDKPEVLMPLQEHFGAEQGTEIVRRLTFKGESSTSHDRAFPTMLKTAVQILEEAGAASGGGGAPRLHQLMLIISDGSFNKKNVLEGVQGALARQQVPVLIICDRPPESSSSSSSSSLSAPFASPAAGASTRRPPPPAGGAPSSSILTKKTVISEPGQPPKMVPYLQDFPFPFYAIVQDPAAIPGVVADVVRQWVEMLKSR